MPRRTATTRVTFDRQFPARILVMAAPKIAVAAELIAEKQRRDIPVSDDGSYGRPAGYARDSIKVWPGVDALGPHLNVGADATTPDGVSYPAILDAGSRPHLIEAHTKHGLYNAKTGQHFGMSVHHPGTKPTYWCRGSIYAIAGKIL